MTDLHLKSFQYVAIASLGNAPLGLCTSFPLEECSLRKVSLASFGPLVLSTTATTANATVMGTMDEVVQEKKSTWN